MGELWLSLSLGKVLTSDAIVISVQPVWVPVRSASGNETGLRFSLGVEILAIEIRPVWIVWIAPIGWCRCGRGRVGACRSRRAGSRSRSVGGRRRNVSCNGNPFRMCDDQKRLVDPAAAPRDTAEQNPSARWVECLGIEPVSLGHRGYYGEGRPRPFSHIGPFNCDDKVRSWNRR